MSPGTAAPGFSSHWIPGVLADSLRVLGRNLVGFLLVAAALRTVSLFCQFPAPTSATPTWADWPSQIGNPLLRLALAAVAQMMFALPTLRTLRGEKATLGDALGGLRASGPVVLATLICFVPQFCTFLVHVVLPGESVLGAAVGLAIAMVGLVVIVTWWLAVSVITVENLGAVAALLRCIRLSKGRRWAILGLTLVIGLIFAGSGLVATEMLGLSAEEVAAPFPTSTARAIWFAVSVFLAAYLAAMATVVYHRLRSDVEGAKP